MERSLLLLNPIKAVVAFIRTEMHLTQRVIALFLVLTVFSANAGEKPKESNSAPFAASAYYLSTVTVGTGGTYTTLKAAFDAINAGTVTGVITIQIISSTTETSALSLSASGSSSANYTSVLIYPTGAGYTISGNLSSALLTLNGADNVTIDGRVNATGSTPSLTITNTSTNSAASAIRFLKSAQKNTIRYTTLSSSGAGSSAAIVLFSSSSSGTGNDTDVIEYCNITSAGSSRPYNAILSSGSSGRENSGNTIQNNNFYNFFNAAASSYGINISSNSLTWVISGNSFYETTNFVPTAGNTYNAIKNSTAAMHTVTGNYIGGSEALCGGTAWNINSSYATYFAGINIAASTATVSIVQNNTIKNMNYSSTNANPWDGIYLASGNFTVQGNTIGASTGTDSIVLTANNAAATATISGGVVTGISIVGGGSGFVTAPAITFSTAGNTTNAVATATLTGGVVTGYTLTNGGSGYTSAPSVNFNAAVYATSHGIRHLTTGAVTMDNNTIGAITTNGTTTYSHCFESIVVSGVSAAVTIKNNLIGSLSTANSIKTASAAPTALFKQDLRGIYINSAVTVATLTGNTIANLTNSYTGTQIAKTDGICTSGGSNTIQNNTIRDLKASTNGVTVRGIQQNVLTAGTTQTITGNSIYNLSNTHATAVVIVIGIDYSGPTSGTSSVSGNFIHSLTASSSNILSELDGIVLGGGVVTVANNIINLGSGLSTGYKINGIYDNSSASTSNTSNLYFNTIYIGGSPSAITSSTSALWNSNNTAIRNYKNNILMNVRNGGTTGKHYAIRIAGTSGLTINNNDYYNYANSFMGYLGGAGDKTTLATWLTATGQDTNSLNSDPLFTIAGGTSALNYYTSAALPALAGTGITTDYTGLTRSVVPKIGALELSEHTWNGTVSSDFGTALNWQNGSVPPDGSDISFAVSPLNNCVLDQNRSLRNINNIQATYKLVVNGNRLTLTGNLVLTNGAKIDATATNSEVVYAGSAAQSITSSDYVSNSIDILTCNNSLGVSMNDGLTVVQNLALSNGAFVIGANTLTLNGTITTTGGTLTGGITSDLVFAGSTTTTLPSVELNDLTINRSGGIALGGTVTVDGTLVLTAGTLSVGANTLTLTGNTPTRTSGTIDASHANATLVFDNATAITLPDLLFTGAINNLSLTGVGGVTAGSDMTINGVLNLAAANPSTTSGLLEMTIDYGTYPGTTNTDYLNSNILTMAPTSSTIGIGDVTGTVKRTTIVANTVYTFGNQYTTITLTDGTMPTELALTITIGATLPGNPDAIKRTYEIVSTGGSNCNVSTTFHYLDNELQSSISPFHTNSEANMVTMDYDIGGGFATPDEHGRSTYDFTNKYIGFANIPISYFVKVVPTHNWRTLMTLRDFITGYYTWDGSSNSSWGTSTNWTPVGVPSDLSHVIIPDAASTPNDPILPANITINTLVIENGGVLVMGSETLTIQNSLSGGWEDQNPLGNDPGTSTVVFTMPGTTISGNARFYNVEVATGADITNQVNSSMKIGNTITVTGTGKWYTDVYDATIEYNGGNQTVLVTDGTPNYHNLILSGSGTKTLPATSLNIHGSLTVTDTASATAAAALNIEGSLIIGDTASFSTGNFSHTLQGDFDNSGTFTAATGYALTFNGTQPQSILGTVPSNFKNIIVNNSAGVGIFSDTTVSDVLTLTSGNLSIGAATLAIDGSISKTSGFLEVSSLSSLSIGGSGAFTFASNLFSSPPSLNNLTLNRSAAINLSQDFSVDGILDLTSGTLNINSNNLTLGATGSIAITTPSATNMIIASGTGEVRKIMTTGGSFTYPIGDNSGTTEYSPITLTVTDDPLLNTYFGVRVTNAKHSNNNSTSNYLNRYWSITQSGVTSFGVAVAASYQTADITGTEGNIKGAKLGGTFNQATNPWVKYAVLNSNLLTTTSDLMAPETTVITGIGASNPIVSASGGTTICNNFSVALSSSVTSETAVTYSWSPADFLNSTTIANPIASNVTVTTPYTLTIRDENGISATATTTVTINRTTWTGTWDNGVPTSTSSVVFESNYTATGDLNVCTITVANNAAVSIPSGFNVTLQGAISVNSGSFTLENNANLLQTTDVVNTGNIIVKRKTNPIIRLDYTLWSSPVANQGLLSFSPLTAISPSVRFYEYTPSSNCYNSVASINSATFTTAKGYLIRLPYNHPTAPIIWNGAFTGVPNNGPQAIALSTDANPTYRFNLIGNPYPSPISITQFASDNAANIESTLYFWRKTNGAANASYCTLNTSSSTFTTNGETYALNPNGIIQTGQGFFVKAKVDGTQVVFNNGQRIANNDNQFFKTVENNTTTEAHRIWLNLTGTGTAFSQAVVGYFSNATDGVDDFDSKMFNDGEIRLSSTINNEDYAIQGRSVPFQATDVVPLKYKVTTAGNYIIAIDHMDGLFLGNQEVYLNDNLTGTVHDLKSGNYSFASEIGTFDTRFQIVYANALGVPTTAVDANQIIVYKNNEDLIVNSGSIVMESIKVFDIRGRLLVTKNGINANQTSIQVSLTNEVLVFQITTTDGSIVTKKVVR